MCMYTYVRIHIYTYIYTYTYTYIYIYIQQRAPSVKEGICTFNFASRQSLVPAAVWSRWRDVGNYGYLLYMFQKKNRKNIRRAQLYFKRALHSIAQNMSTL